MAITASRLRENVYQILDQVLESGVPIEIERKGRVLRLVPDVPRSKLAALPKLDAMIDDPASYIHVDWSTEWKP